MKCPRLGWPGARIILNGFAKGNFAMEVITARASERNPQPSADSIPDGLDPRQHPIIALHFYGWQHLSAIAARIVQRISPPEREP